VLSTGVSQPAFFNDHFNIPRLVSFGVPEEEARDYAINSCMWPVIPGKNIVHRNPTAGSVMVPKALELALNQGKDMKTGEQLGVSTEDPSDLKSIDEIMSALLDQIDFAARGLFSISNIANRLYEEYLQRPFLSALLDGCIERGQELRKWTYMPYSDVMMIGGINAADSLTAIKKLVFDDKKLTIENLITALKNNWKGAEELRQMCLNAPKFGNDEDYADLVVKELYEKIAERLSRIKTYTSGQWVPGIVDGSAATLHYGYSGLTAATPDGRFAGETFADGSISPIMGRDKNGPTAVLMSLSKLDHRKLWNTLHNQTFSPLYLQDQFAEVFTDYLRTWADIGSHHIQFSVVDSETLKAAQKRPQEYHELIVRVCGFSAYFIDLSEGLQNTIIDRTLQCIG
jgi:formate C-acetyltransferase